MRSAPGTFDVAGRGWGGLHLLREVADPTDVASPRTDTIARMDLDGRITKIREGGSSVLLSDGRTILFEDTKSRTWRTCDLEGGGDQPGDAGGLTGYDFPSPCSGRQADHHDALPSGRGPGSRPSSRSGLAAAGAANWGPGLRAMPAWR